MKPTPAKRKPWLKRILIVGGLAFLVGAAVVYYLFTLKFDDTASTKADFTVNALDLIAEFAKNDTAANAKYTEKIITVSGRVSEVEAVDSTVNLKFTDTTTGNYAIFAFQEQHIAAAKTVKQGDSVSVRGSCSGGSFSSILGTTFVTFKRCALIK
ncbi:MAG: hypothetical protein EAY75_01740 [Bacteroidetes bacterium]|nr:MAG: hypothetical protein EAY75_01740 [Bacteroidota bacterium]